MDTKKPKNLPDHPCQQYLLIVSDLGLYFALSSLMRLKALVSPESRALGLFVSRQTGSLSDELNKPLNAILPSSVQDGLKFRSSCSLAERFREYSFIKPQSWGFQGFPLFQNANIKLSSCKFLNSKCFTSLEICNIVFIDVCVCVCVCVLPSCLVMKKEMKCNYFVFLHMICVFSDWFAFLSESLVMLYKNDYIFFSGKNMLNFISYQM